MKTMTFRYNDGGRAAAGFKGSTGDCVTRAIAIATGLPYQQVYDDLAAGTASEKHTKHSGRISGVRTARSGIHTSRQWFKDYMTQLGWKWTPTMGIGTGCKVHLDADELPKGRLIVSVSRHYTAVIDGVIQDTHNPAASRGVTVYPPHYPKDQLPKNARWLSNGNGWAYEPKRCVYGYWSKAEALS